MRLPKIPNEIKKLERQVLSIRGINYTDNYGDGALADSLNISTRRYPLFTTRKERTKLSYEDVTAMTSRTKLVTVKGTKLYYDGVEKGDVTAGAKQFACVNTHLVIWPDKKYLDLNTLTIKPLGATSSGTGATFTTTELSVDWNVDFTTLFREGDAVYISGCSQTANNLNGAIIVGVATKKLTFGDETFTAASEAGTITIERRIPDLDFICESNNRLWGCRNNDQTIYASALGDPTNFFDYSGGSEDSYAVAVGSEGNFTGCCASSSAVLFWKDHTLHKVLGGYPAEYEIYTYDIEGVKDGCSKSLTSINDILFYVGSHGVFTYSGGRTGQLSEALGDLNISNAVGGTDGTKYYLSCKIGNTWKLFVYDTSCGVWLLEDATHVVDFARISEKIYILDSEGDIYTPGTNELSGNWLMLFKPFWETISGSYNSKSPIYERKRFSKLTLRVEVPTNSSFKVFYRADGGDWVKAGETWGKLNDIQRLVIATPRCDKFEIKLEGTGPFTLHEMQREFKVGSDR